MRNVINGCSYCIHSLFCSLIDELNWIACIECIVGKGNRLRAIVEMFHCLWFIDLKVRFVELVIFLRFNSESSSSRWCI